MDAKSQRTVETMLSLKYSAMKTDKLKRLGDYFLAF
ncbi:Uncharacterised protein [Streptococcus pyogenes]|nr:Uncharacterised protein [Streptococcus pyogenes]VGW89762.1 Uncharacterised protein [Streptococcus pyogenes]VGW91131.1 Uncharacterised protein [Streptococcus pyogenes]VGW92501.1 Uncharacterised protein [Streptococcus pyogenes]VGZ10327.1 Uncharacterised protein [Streptococcus pyogenes]